MYKYLPRTLAGLTLMTSLAAGAATQIVMDPSFEDGSPNNYWNEGSINFGTPLCTIDSCGTGAGTTGPRTGDWWAWFGGISSYEEGSVSQSMTFLNGTAELSFWFWNGLDGDASDYIQAVIDGTPVWSYNAAQGLTGGYTQISVNLDAYADGNAHWLSFYSESGLGGNTANFSVDDVTVTTAAVPEPGALVLMGLGLAGLAFARRKRTTSAAS